METQNNNTNNVETMGTLENKNYQSSKNLPIIVVSLIVGIALGFLLDPYLPASFSNTKRSYNDGYTFGFSAAKGIVEKSTVGGFFKSPSEITMVSGTITAVKGNLLTIHSQEINNPFDGPSINNRNVTVSSTTKVFEIKNKTPEAYKAEIAEFMKKKYPPEVAKNLYPTPYSRNVIEISTLKVGDLVGVISTTNIKNAKDFTAKEIQLQPSMIPSAVNTVKK